MKFAEVFAALRKEAGYSQRKVSQELGISQALLSHYENGLREPRLDFIEKACGYYGVTADQMLGMAPVKEAAPQTAAEAAAVCFALEAMCMADSSDTLQAALHLARVRYRSCPDAGEAALRQGAKQYASSPAGPEKYARALLERIKSEVSL